MRKDNTLYILIFTFLALFSLTPLTLKSQEEIPFPSNRKSCLEVDQLHLLMNQGLEEMVSFLDTLGYQMAFSDLQKKEDYIDTIDGIELRYMRVDFNNVSNQHAIIRVYFPKESNGSFKQKMNNMVEDIRPSEGPCSLDSTFRRHIDYRENRESHIFRGTDIYHETNIIVHYAESNGMLDIFLRNDEERFAVVKQRRKEHTDKAMASINNALILADCHIFTAAVKTLDAIDAAFLPDETTLPSTRQQIIKQANQYYFPVIYTAAEKENNVKKALDLCDTLLLITDLQDSVLHLQKVLRERLHGEMRPYSFYNPQAYRFILDGIDLLVNNEIQSNLEETPQHIKINFTFHTEKSNLSNGEVKMWYEIADKQKKVRNMDGINARRDMMQIRINQLAKSERIEPVKEHGITVITNQPLEAEVKWSYFTHPVVNSGTEKDADFKPYIKQIEKDYFTRKHFKKNVNGYDTINQTQLASRREYTFGVTHKFYNDHLYVDIALTDFHTPGPLSWIPSLFIPGLATNRQGDNHSVAARALPFFIFAGFSAAGFIYESRNTSTDRPTFGEADQQSIWEYKNFGYWVGGLSGAAAITIYTVDLSQAITNSVRNMRYTKELREKMKREGSIILQEQNIILWPEN